MLAALFDRIFRQEGGKVLAGLIRYTGDFDLAEDAFQDAVARSLVAWTRDGIPDNPGGWLAITARRRAIDLLRHRKTAAHLTEELAEVADESDSEVEPGPAAESGIDDDRLRLLFTCCHPALGLHAQVALALRTLGGLSTREIARAFLEPEPTTAQRLVRVKQKIRDAKIPYEIPRRDDLPERVAAVLAVVYFIFNEGYAATDAAGLVRPDLCAEAIRLGRLIVELIPDEPEARGLLALLLLHDARRPARVSPAGELVPLEDQDRTLWDRSAIAEGTSVLDSALPFRRPGPYQLQAAIAALHDNAARPEDTDWVQIAGLYGALQVWLPTPVIELNAAVAVAMGGSFARGFEMVLDLERRGELADYHLLAAAKADLLRRAGKFDESAIAYHRALEQTRNPAERAYLQRRLREVEG